MPTSEIRQRRTGMRRWCREYLWTDLPRLESAGCIMMHDNVTCRTLLGLSRRNGNYRRVLGCLLLLMITYGATVEAMHSHGRIAPDRPDIAAISDASGSRSSNTRNSHQTECPICQLQQQLFNGLVHAPLFASTPSAQIARVDTPTVIYPLISTTPRRGRAPPPASLL